MENIKYPKWIDEYAIATHHAFANMVPSSWGPLDGFAIFAALNGTFISKVHTAVTKIKKQKKSLQEVADSFSCLSTLRATLFFLIFEYQQSTKKDKAQFRETIEFLIDVLYHFAKRDPFAYESNIAHTSEEVGKILQDAQLSSGTPQVAREIGKLYTSLASLVFALYRDFFPQDSHEIYGPYSAESKFGEGSMLLIKHFPKIKPVDLWPEFKNEKYSDVKIFQVYKNVKYKCDMIGMHSIYEGDLMNGLVAYGVIVDGKYSNDPNDLKNLSNYFAELATERSSVYDQLSKDELKQKFLEWECYQFFKFFELAGMDWKPTKEMFEAIQGKEIANRLELTEFPPLDVYLTNPEFEVYWLKDLYA